MKAAAVLLAALALALPAAAQTDGRVWTFTETEEGVHLEYGLPESDDLVMAFICNKGSNNAELYMTFEHRIASATAPDGQWLDAAGRLAPWPIRLTVTAGAGKPVTVDASASADDMGGGSMVSWLTPTETPLLRAIGAGGRLTVSAFGEQIAPPPFRKADFRRFLEGCKEG